METIISPVDERRMVCAIEKAASLSLVKDDADRSVLLADCLKSEHVPTRFAKTAAAAYNKRLTVLTFEKRADEHKADSFELADPERVTELMGDTAKQVKTASVAPRGFLLSIEKPAMAKAASAAVTAKQVNYEDRVDNAVFKRHIESVFEKQSALLGENLRKLASAECQLADKRQQLATYLTKSAAGATIIDTACNLYGRRFMDFMRDALPGVHMMKTASGAVKPNAGIYDEIESMLDKHAAIEHERDFLTANAEAVSEFGKSASHMLDVMADAEFNYTDNMAKAAAAGDNTNKNENVQRLFDRANNAQADTDLIRELAQASYNTPPPPVSPGAAIGGALSRGSQLVVGGISAVPELAVAGIRGATGAYSDLMGNAAAKLQAVRAAQSASPGDVVGANFILNDRYMDRLMGWSDVCADRSFSMYPSEEVFTATQRAMDLNPALERPDNRELLKVNVGKLLAQNGRASSADMAELATTLKALGEAQHSLIGDSREVVKAMSDTKAPEAPELKGLVDITAARSAEAIEASRGAKERLAEQAKTLSEEKKKSEDQRRDRWEKAVADARTALYAARDKDAEAVREDAKDAAKAAQKAQENKTTRDVAAAQLRLQRRLVNPAEQHPEVLAGAGLGSIFNGLGPQPAPQGPRNPSPKNSGSANKAGSTSPKDVSKWTTQEVIDWAPKYIAWVNATAREASDKALANGATQAEARDAAAKAVEQCRTQQNNAALEQRFAAETGKTITF